MSDPKHISIESYDYPLPDERIAQFPLEERDSSRLLISSQGNISEDIFSNLSKHLPGNSVIIFNETRVIHARLLFHKDTGAPIEIFCLEPLSPSGDHQQAFLQTERAEWQCLVGNSKRWKSGKINLTVNYNGKVLQITAMRLEKMNDFTSRIEFRWTPSALSFAEVLEHAGKIPLPPYINRAPVTKDEITYQTVYARYNGSVAAPTAGLHFSQAVFKSLEEKNIAGLRFILHVGAGTFKPVTAPDLAGHEMHAEKVYIPVRTLEQLILSIDRPVIAVGTTTTRLLESLYWHGVKVIRGLSEASKMDVRQWDPYGDLKDEAVSTEEALKAVINNCKSIGTEVVQGETSLLIAPGYRFRFPDILITNFHQPKSTLLLLIAAFIGEDWRKAYTYALDHSFRFLSYGDSCLFFKSISA